MDLLEKKYLEQHNKKFVRHPWELAREWIIIDILKSYYGKDFFQHLDMGCGDGYIVSSMARAFPHAKFNGVDVEFTEEHLQSINEEAAGRVRFFKQLSEVTIDPSQKIGITFMDVLEHIEDEVAVLKLTADFAKNKTNEVTFFITVPAYQFLFMQHDVFLKHYRRYTLKTLKSALQAADLQPQRLHYFFFSLFVVRCLKKLITSKEKPVVYSDLIWNHGTALSKVVAGILYLEFKVMSALSKIGIQLPGLSVLAIAR